ncbi:hypothetical protein GCM10010359_40020 [Streptomyces morookaense]|nr:hypothetical protein GCM10010359_40020 [Streptomyces morookaense]
MPHGAGQKDNNSIIVREVGAPSVDEGLVTRKVVRITTHRTTSRTDMRALGTGGSHHA